MRGFFDIPIHFLYKFKIQTVTQFVLAPCDFISHNRQMTSELKNLKTPNFMRKLHPVLDKNEILRVGGRLENAPVEYKTKHPIILPYRHHVTDLIVLQHHQRADHLGQEYVRNSASLVFFFFFYLFHPTSLTPL